MSAAAAPVLALHQLSLYNTGRMTPEQVIAAFAARRPLLERLLADLSSETPQSRPQHHLIVGQRGMGKTMLLARIAASLRTDDVFKTRFIPLVFAEEQYAVDRLSKFWLNCLDSLADARELAKDTAAVAQIDATVARLTDASPAAKSDQPFADEVYAAFASAAQASGQRPVLLVDNLQIVFERLDTGQQHSLRELLMRPGAPIVIGGSPSPPLQTQDYGAAFYDHFKVHYLRPLEETEMRELLLHLAQAAGRDDVRQRVLQHPARLKVLRQLTGGNPRTTLTLFFLYAEDFAPSVFGDLEGLLDRVTPLYKARFEELTSQQQVITSAVANHWDPVTAATLAATTVLPSTTISAQLDRLEKTGTIERVELFGQSSTGYQIAERFFNIWFLMRSASRRQRREVEFLTRFLESFYEPQERVRLARHLMSENRISADRYQWSCAVQASVQDHNIAEQLQRHSELLALRESTSNPHANMLDVLDFRSIATATHAFEEQRNKLIALIPPDIGVASGDFAKAVLGNRVFFANNWRENLTSLNRMLREDEAKELLDTLAAVQAVDELTYSHESVAWFSQWLHTGQLRNLNDAEDWNRTFAQTADSITVRLLVDTIPDAVCASLNAPNVRRILQALRPNRANSPKGWASWAYTLLFKLEKYTEAAEAWRHIVTTNRTDARPCRILAFLLHVHLELYDEAEKMYHEANRRDPEDARNWANLADLLNEKMERPGEAETACRQALALDPGCALYWQKLGDLLSGELGDYQGAEQAYQKAMQLDPELDWLWDDRAKLLHYRLQRYVDAESAYLRAIAGDPKNSGLLAELGNLYCDHLDRYDDATAAFQAALRIKPDDELVHQNNLFLHRDFLGKGSEAKPLLTPILASSRKEYPDTICLHQALFAAYDTTWEIAKVALTQAIQLRSNGFREENTDDWLRASAVLLHLNYGAELITFLDQLGDTTARLRPWVEAVRALQIGDRRALLNIAPEIRVTAEVFYDGIERRLLKLPESTRRRPVVVAAAGKRGRSRRNPR